ncbi:MAG: hypothetical protein DYG89_20375 [Caldilinea sp. CFX5]|nr:hypothetical protein [Caldilinea sp. CFX5]
MKPRVVILVLLLLAFYLRVSGLMIAPPGLYFDEAAHGLDALRVWEGELKLFFPTANGHEPLFTYLVALFVGWLDNSVLAIRLPAAFAGTVAVAASYALGKRLLGPWQAVLGSGFVAVTFWTISLSRMGLRVNTFVPLFCLWLLSFWACRNSTDWRRYLLAGLLLGATQYTYTAARFMPILALILVLDWRKTLWKRGLLLGAVAAFVVTAPLLYVLIADPEIGSLRVRQVWLLNRDEPLSLFWRQFSEHLLMFGVSGDPIWVHNLPRRTPVLPAVALFFWLAVVIGWRRPATRMLLLAVAVMLWPGILAVSNTPVPPDQLRVLEVAPLAFLLAAAGLTWVGQQRRPLGDYQRPFIIGAACVLLLVDGGLSWRDYHRWQTARETYEQLDADMTVLAQDILKQPEQFFIIPVGAVWDEFATGHWTIDYLTRFRTNYHVIPPPYELPPLTAEKVTLVRWLAGMHVAADPQRLLAGDLRLRGYQETDGDERPTYAFENFVRGQAKITVLPLATQAQFAEGLTITGINFYHQGGEDGAPPTLMAEVRWQSNGAHATPLSLSLRLAHTAGAGGAQVDSWLWNERGATAEKWRAEEESRLFLDVDTTTLPAGRYAVTLIPYHTTDQQPLHPLNIPNDYQIGVIELP